MTSAKLGLISPIFVNLRVNVMRQVIEWKMKLGELQIEQIKFDPESRDDIPCVLRGIQYLYVNKALREELFALLERLFQSGISWSVGRPGLNAWRIVLLAVFKQGIDCDFDRLADLANKHKDLWDLLCHGTDGIDRDRKYTARGLMRKINLLTSDLLSELNALVVRAGHEVVGRKPGAVLNGRCDSFVVETDVGFPTDVKLLWDAMRCLVRMAWQASRKRGRKGWLQHSCLTDRIRLLYRQVNTSRRWNSHPTSVRAYIDYSSGICDRAARSLSSLGTGSGDGRQLGKFLEDARQLIDQIRRRLLEGEPIAHGEKMFSIFEECTRWNSKGKAGCPVELGVPVCVVEDQHQFILGHEVLWEGGDTDVAVPIIEQCQERHPELRGCSFDRGFWIPANYVRLEGMLDTVALPKKGRLNAEERMRQADPEFVKARRQHPVIESAINGLGKRGLDRVRSRGSEGFARTVALAIVAANLHRLGRLLCKRVRKRRRPLRQAA